MNDSVAQVYKKKNIFRNKIRRNWVTRSPGHSENILFSGNVLLRRAIVNRVKYCWKKWVNIQVLVYTVGPVYDGPP